MAEEKVDNTSPIEIQDQYAKVYSAFTNSGYVIDDSSVTGFSENTAVIKDLLNTPDLVRFIPTTVQTIVREALEPNLLIVPNCFQTINVPQGRAVQIGAVGAMVAGVVAEGGEYPTQDLDVDGGNIIAVSIAKHGLQMRITDETVEDSQWDVLGLWLRAAGRALARHKELYGSKLLNDMGIHNAPHCRDAVVQPHYMLGTPTLAG